MCGRYTITQYLSELEKLVKFICKVVDFKPRYKHNLPAYVHPG